MATSTCRAHHHQIDTPRLILRSAVPDDAPAIAHLRIDPANSPFMPVEPDLSIEVYQNRIVDWTAAAERGESAFMVIILRDASDLPVVTSTMENRDDGAGTLIGFGGFNSLNFARTPDGSAKEFRIGDTGIMIDHLHWRKGYALEALCATVEYGLYVLRCEHMLIETRRDNEPWRGLMRSMGLGDVEKERKGNRLHGEWVYKFGRDIWEEAKAGMVARGKWML
ncbi:MAG: hypothetical protein M1819_004288 [Sarea resinae]|nr:MAG: hypothetical protein M1819_004288 [Sarea resinae]